MVHWLALSILGTVAAVPSIVLPINSQVPPVARVSKVFQFQFAESTFSYAGASIWYTLSGSPSWLQLDSSARSLFGTPGFQDVGPASFSLIAWDNSGSVAMPVTVVVSQNPGPALGNPVVNQLSTYSTLSGPDTLVVSHSAPIALSFSPDTFTNTDQTTVYYALCANNTPLPSWINFDANTLSFSGTTPQSTSLVELSQTYGIHFTASDVAGFAGAVASFQLVIESHVFNFNPEVQIVEITPNKNVEFSGLQEALTLDGHPANATALSAVTADSPPWMSIDTSSLALTGIPPSGATPLNFTVVATDMYGDKAQTVVCLKPANASNSDLFLKSLEPVDTVNGATFDYTLDSILASNPNLQIFVVLDKAHWLAFDPKSRSIQGKVPGGLLPGDISINITVRDAKHSQTQFLDIHIGQISPDNSSQTAGVSGPANSSGALGSSNTADAGHQVHEGVLDDRHRRSRIAIAVLVPLVVVAAIVFTRLCIVKERRQKLGRSPFIISKQDISQPRMTMADKAGVNPAQVQPVRDFEHDVRHHKRQSSIAPILEDLKRYSCRWSGLGDYSPVAFAGSDTNPLYQLAPEDHERLCQNSKVSAREHQPSSTTPSDSYTGRYSMSKRESRLGRLGSAKSACSNKGPHTRSLSGLGHGRNGFSTSSIGRSRSIGIGHGNGVSCSIPEVRKSWRDQRRLKSVSSWITTEGSSAKSEFHFPRPPTLDTSGAVVKPYTILEGSDDSAERTEWPTIRPVFPSSEDLWPERKAYLESRARHRNGDNVLFSAKDTRVSSQIFSGRFFRNGFPPMVQPSSGLEPPSTPKQALIKKENSASPASRIPTPRSRPSYSRSSSLEAPLKPGPRKSTPRHSRRSHIFRNFPVRAISPLGPLPSNASLNSRFRDAGSEAGDLDLRLEIDEDGCKKWKHVDKPNPLGSNSVRASTSSQQTAGENGRNPVLAAEREFDLSVLLSVGEGSRAQQLNALRDRNGDTEGTEGLQRRPHLGSHRAKRPVSVSNDVGLRHGGPSMKGELGDAGAFI